MYSKIKKLAEERHMTVAELERKCCFGNGTIGKWQKGVSPTIDKVLKVAEMLGVPIEELIDNGSN